MSYQENYDWIKAFKEIKALVKDYRNNQQALIDMLKDAGIAVPADENPKDNKIPLEQMDPFSFLSLINKFPNVSRRAEFVNKILCKDLLNVDVENFSGVPTAHGTAALFFPYKYHRSNHDVDLLWDLFECMDSPEKVSAQMFGDVLGIHSVGFSKLTQGLFWYAPELYLPIDGQTALYLENIQLPQATKVKNANTYSSAWQEYQKCLAEIKQQYSDSFAKLSFDAWVKNGKKYSATQAIQYLEKRYGVASSSTHIQVFKNSQNREIALDPKLHSAKLFIEFLPQIDFFNQIDRIYGIAEKRNHHLDTYSDRLGIDRPSVLIKISNEEDLATLCDWYELLESGSLKERIEQFLSLWPLEGIQKIKFKDYYHAKQYDSFARWLDLFDISMGETYGNNFHVWKPADEKKEAREHEIYQYENKLAWEKKFGQTFDEAFETVKERVLRVAELARHGEFAEIEAIELNSALKWKIAFVYQDFTHPNIYPIFTKEDFKRAGYERLVKSSAFTYFTTYQEVEANRAERSYFDYVKQLSERIFEQRATEIGKKKTKKMNEIVETENMKESKHALNRILFGAAGTGKTYHSINHALAILENKSLDELAQEEQQKNGRKILKERFDQFKKEGRIDFVTFHQSFSYEDFVEGIRAETEQGQLSYDVKPGVFKKICDRAKENKKVMKDLGVRSNATVWKLSMGDQSTRQYCFENSQIRVGWGETGSLLDEQTKYSEDYQQFSATDHHTLEQFASSVEVGDVVLCLKSTSEICGVAVVTGDYFFDEQHPDAVREDYLHCREVNWILKDIAFNIRALNDGVGLTLKTMYRLWRFTWNDLLEALNQAGYLLNQEEKNPDPYILIIDEINRGNISRIFGELITLIEDSKRLDADEELRVTLPYSKKEFAVPKNVYIIGTMNSSDRSLTGLDIALRRRFTFVEMQPDPEKIKDDNGKLITITGLDQKGDSKKVVIADLLKKMNQRIEVLLDRDHCIGHANFMSLTSESTVKDLAQIFRQKIIPQLQEYFFDDWGKIDLVLYQNGMLSKDASSSISRLFHADAAVEELGYLDQKAVWRIQDEAFDAIENYQKILGTQVTS